MCASALLTGAADMSAKTTTPHVNAANYSGRWKQSANPFAGVRMQQVQNANSILDRKKGMKSENAISPEVAAKIGPAALIDDIDTPWGTLWYYTGNFKYTYIKMSEDYERPIMQEFEFTIYNEKVEKVGTIRDKVRYEVYEDSPMDPETNADNIKNFGPYHCETAVASCQVAPIITTTYFNSDDKVEVMVAMSVQTTYYHNNNHNLIYQLGGETYTEADYQGNEQTYNKNILQIPSQLGDVYSTVDANGNEKTLMTFMEDYEPDEEFEFPDIEVGGDDEDGDGEGDDSGDIEIPGYWENYCSYGINAAVYRAAQAGEEGIQKVKSFSFPLSKLPGDMQSSPFLMSMGRDGKTYYVVSRYEDTFYNPYHSPLAEMTMREGNSLIVEIYEESADGGELVLKQTTKIPTYLTKDGDKILASYFGVGDFRYREDVNFGEGGTAGFYVTKHDFLAGSEDSYLNSYYYYNADGSLAKTLFENCESHISMSDLEGFEPQEMFIDTDASGDYVFHFVDLNSVDEVLTLNYRYEIDEDSDPERMTANMDRVKKGDTYYYANELRVPSQDEDGNDIGRVLWFDKKGKFDRIDEVNMGKGVYYAMYYIDSSTLNPDFFHVDAPNEYMFMVKRSVSGSMIEELMVAQAVTKDYPQGRVLLQVGPDENGALARVSTDSRSETPHIFVSKSNMDERYNGIYTWEIYNLPLQPSGIENIADTVKSFGAISYDGCVISCQDSSIEVYSVNGMKVAKGEGNLSTATFDPGVYIVRAAGETAKILVK